MTGRNGSMTQIPEGAPGPSTEPAAPTTTAAPYREGRIHVGDIVLVKLDPDGTRRPLIVASVEWMTIKLVGGGLRQEIRVSGTIQCVPADRDRPLFRGWTGSDLDPATIHGVPDRRLPQAFGEYLGAGTAVGEWVPTAMPPGGR